MTACGGSIREGTRSVRGRRENHYTSCNLARDRDEAVENLARLGLFSSGA